MSPEPVKLAANVDREERPSTGDSDASYRLGGAFSELQHATIMMVDDEPITMEVVQTFLEDAGYREFLLVDDSLQAMDKLRKHRPDVLLLDVVMPEVSGFDILRFLRADEEFAHLPVIILTSSSDAATKLEALDLGATDFLSKPVDPSELALRVRNTLAAKAYQDQLAYYDILTNLPNRQLMQQRADWMIERARREDGNVVLLHLAFGDFKRVTDTLGLKTGDEVLKQIAQRLQLNLQARDRGDINGKGVGEAFRLGTADFCVMLPTMDDMAEAAVVGRHLMKLMKLPFDAEGNDIYLTPSIGIAAFPDDSDDVAQLIRYAVGASSQAMENGGGRVHFYSAEMNEASLRRLQLELDLRRAIEDREFRLAYQPKVDVATGAIVGCEALVRWYKDDQVMMPGDFIPLAEETGLILGISEWVLSEACRQLARWRDAGISTKVAVNVSARQFYETDLLGLVSSAIAKAGIDPADLTLEVTESLVMGHIEEAERTLQRLRKLGIRVSIDDFGTGYSSLSYLKRLPVDEVKIDRSFIIECAKSREDRALVTAVTFLAHKLGYQVCAEGVEEAAQLAFLQKIKCDHYQGYFCSKPVGPNELTARLRQPDKPDSD
ncbi:MAG: EAL domain-containing protein [Sedimenticolaceae bacterium]